MKKLLKLRSIKILGAVVILAGGLWLADFMSDRLDTQPTVTVIDNATGQPIEGALALAQWFSAGGGGLFEGGVDNLDKAVEAYSDKNGNIFIKGYWKSHGRGSRLTVYKPGYVLWDSRRICPTLLPRPDFDENRRTVKLLKFDKEAARWVKEYPDRDSGKPCLMHYSCFGSFVDSETGNIKYKEITFGNIFDHNVLPCYLQEGKEQKFNR
jgi:hypothetical protein